MMSFCIYANDTFPNKIYIMVYTIRESIKERGKNMNIPLLIKALESYYDHELSSDRSRCYKLEPYFQILKESIETQSEIISLKKQANMDTEENVRTLIKLQKYWTEKSKDPAELVRILKEEADEAIHWCQVEAKNALAKGREKELPYHIERLKEAEEKKKLVATYTSEDAIKITGERPF